MKMLLNLYRYLNILSLDVALGAWASGNMAVILLDVKMPFAWQWSLPLSVWVIYTADHLLDAYNLKEKAETTRHYFHVQYFYKILSVWLAGLAICALILPFLLPFHLVLAGVGLGAISLIYFAVIHFIRNTHSVLFLKEWGVGSIYTAGVWGTPFIMKYVGYGKSLPGSYLSIQQALMDWIPDILLMFVCFYLNVMLSVLLFSIWGIESDIRQEQSSWVLSLGKRKSTFAVKTLMGISVFIGLWLVFTLSAAYPERICAAIILTAMSFSHILLWVYSSKLQDNESYRLLGEAVFFLPLFIFMI